MPKFCIYCGNPVKPNDKFCIACGKPLLTSSSHSPAIVHQVKPQKPVKEEEYEVIEPIKEEEIKKEEEMDEEIEEVKEEEEPKKEKDKKKKKEETATTKSLPDDVKHQIDLYVQSTEIEFNKKVLNQKLNDILKATKDPRYETDFDFKQNTNVRLEAIKALISELKENETQLKSEMDDVFIVKKLNSTVDTKETQLSNLTREFRLKKMNKKTFETLKEKYKAEKDEADTDRAEIMLGIKLWIQELKTEKAELISQRKLTKGRLSSKELDPEDYKKLDNEFALKIDKITKKIETLENLAK